MLEKLSSLLHDLVDLVGAKHIRGRAKYNMIGRLVSEIESICSRTDFENEEPRAVNMIQQAQDMMQSGGFRLNRAEQLISLNINGEAWTSKSKDE